jgi:hypothetical protein
MPKRVTRRIKRGPVRRRGRDRGARPINLKVDLPSDQTLDNADSSTSSTSPLPDPDSKEESDNDSPISLPFNPANHSDSPHADQAAQQPPINPSTGDDPSAGEQPTGSDDRAVETSPAARPPSPPPVGSPDRPLPGETPSNQVAAGQESPQSGGFPDFKSLNQFSFLGTNDRFLNLAFFIHFASNLRALSVLLWGGSRAASPAISVSKDGYTVSIVDALRTLREWCSLTLDKLRPGDVMRKLRDNASLLGAVLAADPWIELATPPLNLMAVIAERAKDCCPHIVFFECARGSHVAPAVLQGPIRLQGMTREVGVIYRLGWAVMADRAVYVDPPGKARAWDGVGEHSRDETLQDTYENVQFCCYDLEFPALDSPIDEPDE